MLQACSKHYRPNRLGRVLFMGARGRFAFGRSRPRPSVRKGCLRLAQSGRREAGRMAAPAGKLTTTAPFFIGGILISAMACTMVLGTGRVCATPRQTPFQLSLREVMPSKGAQNPKNLPRGRKATA